jgi:hypothetical protein
VRAEPDLGEWVEWARRAGVSDEILEFVRHIPHVFSDPHANPRAWHLASKVLRACEGLDLDPKIQSAALAGVLKRKKWSAALARARSSDQFHRPLEPADVVEGYELFRFAVKKWVRSGRLDVVAASVELLKQHLRARETYTLVCADRARKSRVEAFFADLPGDLRYDVAQWLKPLGYDQLVVPGNGRGA